MSPDGTAVLFHIATDASDGAFLSLRIGTFEMDGRIFRFDTQLLSATGTLVPEPPKSPLCRHLAAAAAALLYEKRLANFTAADLCSDLHLCNGNASAPLCRDCLKVAETLARYLNEFLPQPEQNLKEIVMSTCDQMGRREVGLSLQSPASEGFFGFGERFDAVNQRGRSLYCWCEDGGWSLSVAPDQRLPKLGTPTETYMPAPFLLSSHGHGLYIDTALRTNFDLAHTSATTASLAIEATSLPLVVLLGTTPADTVRLYTNLTGARATFRFWEGPREGGHSVAEPIVREMRPFSGRAGIKEDVAMYIECV